MRYRKRFPTMHANTHTNTHANTHDEVKDLETQGLIKI